MIYKNSTRFETLETLIFSHDICPVSTSVWTYM